jgi:hypothetical protein
MVPVGAITGGLRVAVAVGFAEREGLFPAGAGALDEALIGAGGVVERHRVDREALVALGEAVRGAAVVADHAEHVVRILLVAREGAELARDLGRGRVGHAGHDGGERAAERPAGFRVVRKAHGHQEAADIGVAEAERPVGVGQFGDLAARELGHGDRDLEHGRPEPAGVLVRLHVDAARGAVVEGEEVRGGEIAGGVVQETCTRSRGSRP